MLISIEGLDGVGKTTMVSNISKALKIPTIEKTNQVFSRTRSRAF